MGRPVFFTCDQVSSKCTTSISPLSLTLLHIPPFLIAGYGDNVLVSVTRVAAGLSLLTGFVDSSKMLNITLLI